MKRSDLICENGVINNKEYSKFVHNYSLYRTNCTELIVDSLVAEECNIKEGRYITIYCNTGDYCRALEDILKKLLPAGRAFVAGLGNEKICSDSLGAKAIRFVPATSHLTQIKELQNFKMREVSVIGTSVTGKTGIESTEYIKCLSESVGADFIVVIDSLACSDSDKLCCTIQITDTGISPGAGVGNDRKELSEITTGKKVIAIGVPTVIDYENSLQKFMVTPRNIDVLIDELSKKIGFALSRALNPTLSDDEIEALIIR